MSELEYFTAKGQKETVRGSRTRINVSSRSDSRDFYVSRDNKQGYCLSIIDPSAEAGDLVAYLKNTSTTLILFIRKIKVFGVNAATWNVAYGDDTAATGTSLTPTNLNKSSNNTSDVSALGNGAVGGVTATTFIASLGSAAGVSDSESFKDMLMLGQNDNIVVEYDAGTTGGARVDIYFYMDTLE